MNCAHPPFDPQGLTKALDLARSGDCEASVAILEAMLAETPNTYIICLALSCILERMEQFELASRFYNQAALLNPIASDLLYDGGDMFRKTGQYPQAISAYKQFMAAMPEMDEWDRGTTYSKIGAAAWKSGDLDEALGAYREAALRLPRNARVQYWFGWTLGKVACRDGLEAVHEEVEAIFRQVLVLEPSNGGAYGALATALFLQNKWGTAAEAFREAARLRPHDTKTKLHLGRALGKAADQEKDESLRRQAVEIYRQIVVDEPDNGAAYKELGTTLSALGDTAEAIAAYRHAVRCQPTNAWLHHILATLLAKQGQHEESIHSASGNRS